MAKGNCDLKGRMVNKFWLRHVAKKKQQINVREREQRCVLVSTKIKADDISERDSRLSSCTSRENRANIRFFSGSRIGLRQKPATERTMRIYYGIWH